MNKYALLGKGKTGQFIADLLGERCRVFSSKQPATLSDLMQVDVIICFVPNDAFSSILPLLIECKKPVVIGTTGITIDASTSKKIEANGLTWIIGSNFALGMSLIYHVLKILSQAPKLFSQFKYNLHEVHHVHKKDAPSGTALSWREWVGDPQINITSERIGDVVGTHQLTLSTASEKITIEHQSLDRSVFAQGAIWAADYLLANSGLAKGIIKFEEITREVIHE